jgi:hypothetical protein
LSFDAVKRLFSRRLRTRPPIGEPPPETRVPFAKLSGIRYKGTPSPDGITHDARLAIGKKSDVAHLPVGLTAPSIDGRGHPKLAALPDGLDCAYVDVSDAARLSRVGARTKCGILVLDGTAIERLPDDLQVAHKLSARRCRHLKGLPEGLAVAVLALDDCAALERLPAGLSVAFLDLANCISLQSLPDGLRLLGGRLNVRDCGRLTRLPDRLGEVAQLDISGCLNITSIPEGLRVTSWIDIAHSGIARLPAHLQHVGLRWRGVPVSERIVFRPETLSTDEILGERNTEVRRVMLERFGFERFMENAKAEELDRDRDGAGGERRLLRVPMPNDEDLVCVSVTCPSTQRRFVLRVPPRTTSCRQAVAWTAGFDDPKAYRPIVET